MGKGLLSLEEKIDQFMNLLEEMKEETREAHSVLKQMQKERRELEKYITTEGRQRTIDRVDEAVVVELEKIGPTIREQTNLIYEKVGREIDKLIDLSMGKEFSHIHGREDLRPKLAAKLREWLKETINE